MFDKEFYPTPVELIQKMLHHYRGKFHKGGINGRYRDGYKIKGTILEPSAGKGDIIDYIVEHTSMREMNIYVCEKSVELQAVLKDKNYQLVCDDFLHYECDMYYDHIIMNPPFSNGDEHLLKAIDIADDTNIVCLLNAETIRNPYSQKRQELMALLEKYEYEVDFVEDAFKYAERKANVDVAIVRLYVPAKSERFEFDFSDSENMGFEINEDFMSNEIARKDVIGNMIHIYDKAKDAYVVHMEAQAKFHHYASMLIKKYKNLGDMTKVDGSYKDRYNFFCSKMKENMWEVVIDHLNLEKYMSSNVINNFNVFIKQQSKMAFTKENTQAFFEMIMMNTGNILEKAILDVFDSLTKHYHENRMKVEGWKTNDSFKVNQKIIAPYMVTYGEYLSQYDLKQYGDTFSVSFSRRDTYADLDKVLCYISGKDFNQIVSIGGALERKFKEIGKVYPGDKFDNKCESTFFELKFFRKGTVHLKFKDKDLWEEFNIRAAKEKNWLPEDYEWKKKPEEKKEDPVQNEDGQFLLM